MKNQRDSFTGRFLQSWFKDATKVRFWFLFALFLIFTKLLCCCVKVEGWNQIMSKACEQIWNLLEKRKMSKICLFPLAKSVWPHIGYTAQYEFEKRLRFPSFKSCHALHSGFGKSFWNCFCSHARGTQIIRTLCCRCFEFATLRCQLQLQWTLLLKSHLHTYPMPFLQIWAEISVMFTLMCIVYAGTGHLVEYPSGPCLSKCPLQQMFWNTEIFTLKSLKCCAQYQRQKWCLCWFGIGPTFHLSFNFQSYTAAKAVIHLNCLNFPPKKLCTMPQK